MEWEAVRSEADIAGNSFAGNARLPETTPWPSCKCGEAMELYFQLDLPDAVETLKPGSHLLFFQCPKHTEACFPPDDCSGEQLPEGFWKSVEAESPHTLVLLLPPGSPCVERVHASKLQAAALELRPAEPYDARECDIFQVGGRPVWYDGAETKRCGCGAPMQFVCQLPENYGFPKREDAPEQDDSPEASEYVVCLGNVTYVLACSEQCNPRAVWIVNQN